MNMPDTPLRTRELLCAIDIAASLLVVRISYPLEVGSCGSAAQLQYIQLQPRDHYAREAALHIAPMVRQRVSALRPVLFALPVLVSPPPSIW
jgi:hypothetical protein